MDESLQKQIESSLLQQPEHWVWEYRPGMSHAPYIDERLRCTACIETKNQSRQACCEGHFPGSGRPILFAT